MTQEVRLFWLAAILAFPSFMDAQSSEGWLKKLEGFKIQPTVVLQIWGTYTTGQEVYDAGSGAYQPIDDRLNFQLRRSRIGFKGQAYEHLHFNFTTAIDWVGRDVLSGTEAGFNNGGSPQLRLWNAFVQWRVVPKKEWLNVVAGYFVPTIGRESMTSAFRSTSMEKSWSQNYLRRHLTGIGPGRTMGVNIGGLWYESDRPFNFRYDLGIYSPTYESFGGNSSGLRNDPLLVARFAVDFGDPEATSYGLGHKINYFGTRQGFTLAVAGVTQGETDLFLSNRAFSVDALLNWGNWNVDAEWSWLQRSGQTTGNGPEPFSIQAQTGYIRVGRNVSLPNGYVLEPVLMQVWFTGEMNATEQSYAELVGTPSGQERIGNAGVNFYFNPDLKLSMHYTWRAGDPGAAGNGAIVNNYFYQRQVGAIHRGNWLGLGLVLIL